MQQIIGRATASKSFSASLVLAFAALSLMLAAVGLYGVLSYLVTQRVSEIGIRMALGAQRSEVLRLIIVDGMRACVRGTVDRPGRRRRRRHADQINFVWDPPARSSGVRRHGLQPSFDRRDCQRRSGPARLQD